MELPEVNHWNANQYGKFSLLIKDYLDKKDKTNPLYSRFPSELNLAEQATSKLISYQHRDITFEALQKQLCDLNLSKKQKENLEKFRLPNSVTITTGHQLNLFTGPLYFFYKIIQVLNACEEMQKNYPKFNFIPVFWMATEDHDFDEINHFYYKNQKFVWNKKAQGAVGRLSLDGLKEVFDSYFKQLPNTANTRFLRGIIDDSYFNSKTLTEATRKLVQSLFSEYGLLMIDGDDKSLKSLMIPAFKEDLVKNIAFEKVSTCNDFLRQNDYSIQVNPREINLFYLGDGNIRERIVNEGAKFKILNTNFEFTEQEILTELHKFPEKFSPNVLLRPLYQETILPNIAYVGGAGEIAYWLQLKEFFETEKISFPILIVRNSLLLLTTNQHRKLEKLGISFEHLFQSKFELVNENIAHHIAYPINFSKYEHRLELIFKELEEQASATDPSFSKMVLAQQKKQLNGLDKMKKRYMKAERKLQSDRVKRIETLYSELFPFGNLQERIDNFSEFYEKYGAEFYRLIEEEIRAIDFQFTIKTLG